ncbi:MAG TPA: VWA domain-containing protein [Myxococcota bacterium]|nr:VWA domain-containing protein [Myxococcota bacterium]HRY96647.1 VWA domain-containing protein [Myxococcota bacterium]
MTDSNLTELVCIVDRSGSMGAIQADAEGGLHALLEDQSKQPGECRLTLAQFDNEYDLVHDNAPLGRAVHYRLEPRGTTALLDAMGRTILAVGQRLANTPESQRPGKVIVVIVTDGQENASVEFSRKRVMEMVTHQREAYSWQFVFLAANQDAIAEGSSLGIQQGRAMNFRSDGKSVRKAYDTVSRSVLAFRTSGQAEDLLVPKQADEDD